MKYLAILCALLLVMFGNYAEARIGSEQIVAHREAEQIVDVARDRSQLARRELKVCRRVCDLHFVLSLPRPMSLLYTFISSLLSFHFWAHIFVFFRETLSGINAAAPTRRPSAPKPRDATRKRSSANTEATAAVMSLSASADATTSAESRVLDQLMCLLW